MRKARVAALTLVAASLCAQDRPYNGHGYAYFTGGFCQHNYVLVGGGGGGEAFLWRGLAVGGEVGFHQFLSSLNFGLASATVGYHFVNRKRPGRFDPFVNFSPAGLYFGPGTGGAGGIGGGLNYWFKPRMGLRTEVRFQVLAAEEALAVFRIGLSFR